ncbi:MAG TPA: ABC transporter permease [Bryobacteraceae bacterium]|nr:ABC transporter permease [Bryobacteraceae bacterium]
MKLGPWILRRRSEESELDEEIRFHLSEEQKLHTERGASPVDARFRAQRDFGNTSRVKEETRAMWSWTTLESVMYDARYALRQLRRAPGFTAVAIATLALGIGANTAIFSVVDAVLLKPLPFRDASRLVAIHEALPEAPYLNASWPDYLDWRAGNHVFEDIGVFQPNKVKLRQNGTPTMVPAAFVSSSLFSVLGTQPFLGRLLSDSDDRPGAPAVAVISYALWQRALAGDPNLEGKSVEVEGFAVNVAGVLGPESRLPQVDAEIYLPLRRMLGGSESFSNRANHPGLLAFARLRPGVSVDTARADMNAIMKRLAEAYPASNKNEAAKLSPLPELLLGAIRPELLMLFGAAALVLLLACANVAHLAMARASSRQREFAVRASLGAGSGRLLRQLLTESVLLALAGGIVGALWANWSVAPLVRLSPYRAPGLSDAHVDTRVLLFTLAASLAAALAFGCAPVLQTRFSRLNRALREGDGGGAGRRFRSALFVGEVAIALVLATGAGLLLRSVFGMLHADPGFRPDHLISFSVARPNSDGQGSLRYFTGAVDLLARQPGVVSSGAVMCPPFGGTCWTSPYWRDGHAAGGQHPWTALNMITPGYFNAMQMPLLAGRAFTSLDNAGSRAVAVVNQSMSSILGPGSSVGKLIHVQYSAHEVLEVVGVVPDVPQYGTGVFVMPEVYVPAAQMPVNFMTFVVRSQAAPGIAAREASAALRSLDKEQPITDVSAFSETILQSAGRQRFAATLLSMFGFVALTLAAVGISGMMAYTVIRRTRELGIRVALGARRATLLRMVIGEGMTLVLIGLVLGIGLAWMLAKLVSNLLYGVKPHDPATFAAATLVLATCAFTACLLPAIRAARVDPVVALRHD